VVVLDRMSAGVPSVLANHSQAEHLDAEHLSGLGHQHISYVAGPVKSWADGSRWHALQNAAADLHLQVCRLGPFMPTVGGGCDAAAELTRTRTSAVVTFNDYLLIHRLARDGIRVPDEVSIVGYGDIPAARLVTPSSTTRWAAAAEMADRGRHSGRSPAAALHRMCRRNRGGRRNVTRSGAEHRTPRGGERVHSAGRSG